MDEEELDLKDKIRVAVVGMGNMGRGHAAHMVAIPEAELVALCDASLDAAVRFPEEKQLDCHAYDNFSTMLEAEKCIRRRPAAMGAELNGHSAVSAATQQLQLK